MSFRFSIASTDSLADIQRLIHDGTVEDLPRLMICIKTIANPRLREAACLALKGIGERSAGHAGETVRPLRTALPILQQMIQTEHDQMANAAAREASAVIQRTTGDLPAWSMPVSSSKRTVRPSTPPKATSSWDDVLAAEPSTSTATSSVPVAAASSAAAASASTSSAQPWATKRQRAPTAKDLGVRPSDEPLYAALCDLRASIASSEGRGAHTIADNKTLALIALNRPKSRHSLLNIKGIGQHKADAYGAALLTCVSQHPAPSSVTREEMAAGGGGGGDGGASSAAAVTASSSSSSSSSSAPRAGSALSAEQARAVQLVNEGENVFLTGGAGTGKSFTLRTIIDLLRVLHVRQSAGLDPIPSAPLRPLRA